MTEKQAIQFANNLSVGILNHTNMGSMREYILKMMGEYEIIDKPDYMKAVNEFESIHSMWKVEKSENVYSVVEFAKTAIDVLLAHIKKLEKDGE